MHGASGAGELLGPHSSPPPQEPWRGLCALCNDQCPSARLVRAPGGAGGSWAAWWVPPQGSESGCVAWVLFSISWGTQSRFQVQPFYYSDHMVYSLILGFKSPAVDRSRDLVTSELPAQGAGRPALSMRLQIQHKNPSCWVIGSKGLCWSFLLRSHTHAHAQRGLRPHQA